MSQVVAVFASVVTMRNMQRLLSLDTRFTTNTTCTAASNTARKAGRNTDIYPVCLPQPTSQLGDEEVGGSARGQLPVGQPAPRGGQQRRRRLRQHVRDQRRCARRAVAAVRVQRRQQRPALERKASGDGLLDEPVVTTALGFRVYGRLMLVLQLCSAWRA